MAEEIGEVLEFDSFTAAKRYLERRCGPKPGHDLHHVVEQCQTKTGRSNFPTRRINSTDNFVWLPKPVHKLVSKEYSTTDPDVGVPLRDALNNRPWEVQYNRGVRVMNRAWRRYEQNG